MAYITALDSFPNFQDYKDQGKLAYASEVRTWLSNLLTFQTQANAQRDEVLSIKNQTKSIRDEAVSLKDNYFDNIVKYRNETYAYKNTAETAANRAEAVVIPTEATYSLEALETSLNGLLTQSVAQAAQISILKQGL